MIDVTLTFNGYDFSSLLSKYDVRHAVEVVELYKTIDGTEHTATVLRPIIEFSLVPMSESKSSEVYAALSVINANCSYTDPNLGDTVTNAPFRVTSDLENLFRLKSIDGNRYYRGGTIVLRRKTVL